MKTLPEHWNAKWIAPAEKHKRHPVFLRSFSLSKPVREAMLYITGYGLFEAYLIFWRRITAWEMAGPADWIWMPPLR